MYTFDFAVALNALRQNKRVRRKCWQISEYLYMVPGSEFKAEDARYPLSQWVDEGTVTYRSHIDLFTADEEHVPWTPTQTDILADDWYDYDVG